MCDNLELLKEFKKLVKKLPGGQKSRLPEKIRVVVNRPEHSDYIKAICIGAVLDMEYDISLSGYVDVPEDISQDKQYCTTIKDEQSGKMIIGTNDEIHSSMSVQDFKNKVFYA